MVGAHARNEELNAAGEYEGVCSATAGLLERLPHQLHEMGSRSSLYPSMCVFPTSLKQA